MELITRLLILGLLMQKPLSGYAIQIYLQRGQTDLWAGIQSGSVYHALKKLTREGLIVIQATEQTGNRTKAIYAITNEGKKVYRQLLRESLGTPFLHFPTGIYAALSFLDDLPREEVMLAIDRQIELLEQALTRWNACEKENEATLLRSLERVPTYIHLLFANARQHIETDLHSLRTLRELLPTIEPVPLLPEDEAF